MSKHEKLLDKMRHNPRDWRIEDIKTVAHRYGIAFHQPGTSHVTFRFLNGEKLTIPAHKPIKPIYIQQFIALLDRLLSGGSENE
jgi:hypothetical protein